MQSTKRTTACSTHRYSVYTEILEMTVCPTLIWLTGTPWNGFRPTLSITGRHNLTGSRRLANKANVDIISSVIRSGIPIRRSAAHFSMIRAYQMMGTKRTDRRDGQIFQSFRFSRVHPVLMEHYCRALQEPLRPLSICLPVVILSRRLRTMGFTKLFRSIAATNVSTSESVGRAFTQQSSGTKAVCPRLYPIRLYQLGSVGRRRRQESRTGVRGHRRLAYTAPRLCIL
ncbi:hypothetical protein BD769DRAFT_419834 [Suillus cothurnatus]|nr:hypothetical protein BD769DRAFT_419834 [Suillus cothurnatus]